MVTKTYLKSTLRMFRKHIARFLSLLFIVLVSVGFISGFGMAATQIDDSLNDYYIDQNVSDFIVKSRSQSGFSEEEIAAVRALFPDADIETGASFDLKVSENRSVRFEFRDLDGTVDLPEWFEGTPSASKTQIYAEWGDDALREVPAGTTFTLDFAKILTRLAEQNGTPLDTGTAQIVSALPPVEVIVTAKVLSPLHFVMTGEPSYNNPENVTPDTTEGVEGMDLLEAIFYLPTELIPTVRDAIPALPESMDAPLIPTGDIYIAMSDRSVFGGFTAEYGLFVEQAKAQIAEALPDAAVLSLYDNYSFLSLASYGDKLTGASYIVMAVFLFVTALVAFTTVTRLLDEERQQIACLATLGYSPSQILFKYILFALVPTAIGGIGAFFIGMGISNLVYTVFWASFAMPPVSSVATVLFYAIALVVIVGGTLGVTAVSGSKLTKQMPAVLLRPKVPKAGGKVFLEKLPSLWRCIPFKWKSTLRNVFRYAGRLVMSVVSIAVSAGLVLTGLALLDVSLFHLAGSAAIVGISVVIIIFAGLLTAVVIYTLTNISISERNREIATLMVLGYTDKEVTGYVYREVYLNSLLGTLFGYPVGSLLIWLLYTIIGSGTVGGMSWFMWIAAPVVIFVFTFFVTLALRHKILGIDMNESLKSVE